MNDEQMAERELSRLLPRGSFTPATGDGEFLNSVRGRIALRRKRRAARSIAGSFAVALLFVLLVQNGAPLLQQNVSRNFASSSLNLSNLTDTLLSTLTESHEDWLGTGTSDDSLTRRVSSDLALLFQEGDVYDPIEYLSGYDEVVQDRLLEQLKQMDILNSSGVHATGEREKI